MTRYTRKEAKALGLPTCYGSPCSKHPELEGLRRVSGACVQCAKVNLNANRAVNKERTQAQRRKDFLRLMNSPVAIQKKRERDAQYRKENKVTFRAAILAWSEKNPEKVKQYAAKTKAQNKGRVNACTAKRRYSKLLRTPKWLTQDDIWLLEQAYEIAALRTKMFGYPWHVDHVIPLQGKLVSGLHVPQNVQVIPWFENVQKANQYEVAV